MTVASHAEGYDGRVEGGPWPAFAWAYADGYGSPIPTNSGGLPRDCSACPFSGCSVEPFHEIGDDLGKAHYPCALLEITVVGGEAPCTTADWHARALRERLDWHAANDQPTEIYLLHDADGTLLYVGISLGAARRLSEHRRQKPWWNDVVRIDIVRSESRPGALRQERRLIRKLKPLYNIQGRLS